MYVFEPAKLRALLFKVITLFPFTLKRIKLSLGVSSVSTKVLLSASLIRVVAVALARAVHIEPL